MSLITHYTMGIKTLHVPKCMHGTLEDSPVYEDSSGGIHVHTYMYNHAGAMQGRD